MWRCNPNDLTFAEVRTLARHNEVRSIPIVVQRVVAGCIVVVAFREVRMRLLALIPQPLLNRCHTSVLQFDFDFLVDVAKSQSMLQLMDAAYLQVAYGTVRTECRADRTARHIDGERLPDWACMVAADMYACLSAVPIPCCRASLSHLETVAFKNFFRDGYWLTILWVIPNTPESFSFKGNDRPSACWFFLI